jgi:hypothetical protein
MLGENISNNMQIIACYFTSLQNSHNNLDATTTIKYMFFQYIYIYIHIDDQSIAQHP